MKSMIVIALALVSANAFGARVNTQSLSCGRAAGIVQKAGAIVLATGEGLYDRFVADGRYCASGETTAPAWVPTSETDTCFVGYVCRDRENAGGVVFPRAILKCKEGKQELISEPRNDGEGTESVLYVCKSGIWKRVFGGGSTGGEVRPITCKEGKREIWLEQNSSGEGQESVHVICRSGKWVREF